jgi:WD40 repeat protein
MKLAWRIVALLVVGFVGLGIAFVVFLNRDRSAKEIASFSHYGEITSLQFSSDGLFLAVGSKETRIGGLNFFKGEVTVWNVGRKTMAAQIVAPGWVQTLAMSPNGQELAVGCTVFSEVNNTDKHGELRLYHFPTLNLKNKLVDSSPVKSLAFAPDGGGLFFSGPYDDPPKKPKLVLVSNLEIKTHLEGIRSQGCGGSFSPDGKTLVVGDVGDHKYGVVKVFHASDGKLMSHLADEGLSSQLLEQVAFSSDGKHLAKMFQRGGISLVDMKTMRAETSDEFRNSIGRCRQFAFSPNGRFLAGTGIRFRAYHTEIVIWDLVKRKVHVYIDWRENPSYQSPIAFSPDGTKVAVGSKMGEVKVFEFPWD